MEPLTRQPWNLSRFATLLLYGWSWFCAITSNGTCIGAEDVEVLVSTTVTEKALTFASGPARRFAETVNGRTHQQSPLTTYRGYQYVSYYDDQRRLCLGRRKLPNGSWDIMQFQDHRFESNDSHNTAVIGICDRDGTIHLAFDHHASQLNYRVSQLGVAHHPESIAWSIDLFSPVAHSLGSVTTNRRVTYPRFFSAPNGNLMLYYRAVTSGNGDGMIEEYDGERHDWTKGLGRFIARDMGTYTFGGNQSQLRCPYMNSLSYAGHRLYASWIWRDRFEKTDVNNQHDLCYAYSEDHGRTWLNTNGKVIGRTGSEFVHLNSSDVVVAPLPSESGLTNQNTHYAYADGSIHVVMRHHVQGTLKSRYHHYWRTDSGDWKHEALPFSGSRPKMVGTDDRTLVLIYTVEDKDERKHLQIAVGHPHAERIGWQWTEVELPQSHSLCGDALLDLERWNAEGLLSIYGQIQPTTTVETDSLEPLDGLPSALMVVDYRLSDRLKSATAKFEKRIVSKAPPGRLAVVVDGNSPDPDDIGATAVTLGLLDAAGLSDRLVHLSHSCDLEPVARISPADELRRQKILQLVCSDGLARFGPFENLAGFFNCRTEQESAVADLRDAINDSSENDPLWIIVAGEPDVIGYALQAASAPRHPHVHVVSHHPANDNSGDFFSWQQILDFGVTEHQIGDQNVGLQTGIAEWDWARSHRNGSIRWIHEQLAIAERDRVVKFQKGKFDCSDAGMVYWWLTGADQGGNAHATPKDIAEVLQQATA